MPEAPSSLRAGAIIRPAYVRRALTSVAWRLAHERVQPAPRIRAAKNRRADSPHSKSAPHRPAHDAVRKDAGRGRLRGGRWPGRLHELPAPIARPKPDLGGVLRAGGGLAAAAAFAGTSPRATSGFQGS